MNVIRWILFVFIHWLWWAAKLILPSQKVVNQNCFDDGFSRDNSLLARLKYVKIFQDSRIQFRYLPLFLYKFDCLGVKRVCFYRFKMTAFQTYNKKHGKRNVLNFI